MSATNNYAWRSSEAKLAELLRIWGAKRVEDIGDFDAQAEGFWLLHRVQADLDAKDAERARKTAEKKARAIAALKRGVETNKARSAALKDRVRAALTAGGRYRAQMARDLGIARSTFYTIKREIEREAETLNGRDSAA